jgi:hypothetical protein
MASAAMNDLGARKRELLLQSEFYRQRLAGECAHVQAATAWISRTLHYARMVAPILALAAPAIGWMFGSRKKRPLAPPPPKRNLLAKIMAGYQIARQIKPVWDGFRKTRMY